MRRLTASLLLLALFLAACGDDDGDTVDAGGDSGDPATVTLEDLEGRAFDSTGSTGYEIVESTTISLTFADGRISANAGCNTQNGGVEVVDGQLRLTSQLASTMMGCEEPLMAQDQWVASFLEADPDVTLDGDALTLTADDESLELNAES
jgi:heat shock protein HslJ